MIQSTQRKMLRLIIQTKRRYKTIGKRKDETNEKEDIDVLGSTGDESEDGQSSNAHNDQDSDISFENDTDEEIDTIVIEEEKWIDYIKRSTDEAMENMENAKIRCWNKTHRRMTWRLALRIASLPNEMVSERLQNGTLNSAQNTRPTVQLGDQEEDGKTTSMISSNLKRMRPKTLTESSSQINKTWIKAAKDRGRWTLLENDYTMTTEERSERHARFRRNTQSRPVRYVNGMRLSDDEVANIILRVAKLWAQASAQEK